MNQVDTIHLLQECDAGTKMAVTALEDVCARVQNNTLRTLLQESKTQHCALGNQVHCALLQHDGQPKDPSLIAKSMSAFKTGWKMSLSNTDATAAALITDGCNMGVKALQHYRNTHASAAPVALALCDKLIDIEEQLETALHPYL